MREVSGGLLRRRAFKRELGRFMENWVDVEPVSNLFEQLIDEMKNKQHVNT